MPSAPIARFAPSIIRNDPNMILLPVSERSATVLPAAAMHGSVLERDLQIHRFAADADPGRLEVWRAKGDGGVVRKANALFRFAQKAIFDLRFTVFSMKNGHGIIAFRHFAEIAM